MYNKIVVTIIISLILCTFYGLKGEELCRKILVKNRYIRLMERADGKYKQSISKPAGLCAFTTKVSYHFFAHPNSYLCPEYIASLLPGVDNVKVWSHLTDKCEIKDKITDLISCAIRSDLQTCINDNIPFALEGLANKEAKSKYACKKCEKFPFLVKCAKRKFLHQNCPSVFTALTAKHFSSYACLICKQENRISRPTNGTTLKPTATTTKENRISRPTNATTLKPTATATKADDKNQDNREKLRKKNNVGDGERTTKQKEIYPLIAGGVAIAIILGLLFTFYMFVHCRKERPTVERKQKDIAISRNVRARAEQLAVKALSRSDLQGPESSVQNNNKDRLSTPSTVVSTTDDTSSSMPTTDKKRKRRRQKQQPPQ